MRLLTALLYLVLLCAPATAWVHGVGGAAATCATSDAACDPSSVTLFNAMTTPADARHRVCINNYIVFMKLNGLFSKFAPDPFHQFVAQNEQASRLSWTTPGTNTLVPHNSPVFAADQGWNGNGSTEWLDSPWAPNTGVNYTTNDASHFGVTINTNTRQDSTAAYGGRATTLTAYSNPWNGTVNTIGGAVNNTAVNSTFAPQNGIGLFLYNRINNTANFTISQNGTDLGTVTAAIGGRPTFLRILSMDNTNFTTRPVAAVGFGASLNGTERSNLYIGQKAYLDCLTSRMVNFVPQQQTMDKTTLVTRFDTNLDVVDSHNGNLLQVGSDVYMYGTKEDCAAGPGTGGAAWCGIGVYLWPGGDMSQRPVYKGLVIDPAPLQTDCGKLNGNYHACYGPKMLPPNPVTGKYVLWFWNQLVNSTVANQMFVYECDTPTGGATPTTPGTNCVQKPTPTFPFPAMEQPSFFIHPNGVDAYACVTNLGASLAINMMQLTANWQDIQTGTSIATGLTGEGNGCFMRGANTYIFTGSAGCAYCVTASTFYGMSTTGPLGTYSAATNLNSNSCLGQFRDATTLTINGIDSYFISVDQYWAQVTSNRSNQGFATTYFQPVIFESNGTILPWTCQNEVRIPGMLTTPISATPPVAGYDQYSRMDTENFNNWCDITNSNQRMQTFVTAVSTVASVSLGLGKNNAACTVPSSCPSPDGSLVVSLVTLDGSKNPLSTLASQTIPASSLKWAIKWTSVNFSQAVTPGTEYGVTLKATGMSNGCFGTVFNQAGTQPYAAGVHRLSTDTGATWNTVAGSSLMFGSY